MADRTGNVNNLMRGVSGITLTNLQRAYLVLGKYSFAYLPRYVETPAGRRVNNSPLLERSEAVIQHSSSKIRNGAQVRSRHLQKLFVRPMVSIFIVCILSLNCICAQDAPKLPLDVLP